MTAELSITRLRHDFEYRWQIEHAKTNTEPSDEEVAALLELARQFVLSVDDAVSHETGTWIAEFRSSLEQADQGLAQRGGT